MPTPFNAKKYFKLQSSAIKERLLKFKGKLYFEIGGKFANDEHASRVLPGFDPHVKIKIIKSLNIPFEIIFCVSSKDIKDGRVWKSGETYEETIFKRLDTISQIGFPKPLMVINLYEAEPRTVKFENALKRKGYKVYKRYFIKGYPKDLELIASKDGFGKDDYIETSKRLVLVIGAGSLSGKMSTCLGQVYHDDVREIDSGYAKYETFPIWNLPLEHPVNLAYEAATADIGDYNVYDPYHEEAYGKRAVNYNRDVEAFPIIRDILDKIVAKNNYMRQNKSPTDMGISNAGFCIEDDTAVRAAAIDEIKRRKEKYAELVKVGRGKKEWPRRCEELMGRV
jgi:uncharacterized protein (UPF0371 family)